MTVFFVQKRCFFIKFCIFSKFKIFSDFSQKFTIKVEKTFSRNKIIWYSFYSKFANLIDLVKISFFFKKTHFLILKKNFGRVVKTAFYESRDTFWGTVYFWKKINFFLSFSDFEQRIFGLLAKNFRQCCQNCILRVQKNITRFPKKFPKHHCPMSFLNWTQLANIELKNVPIERKIFIPFL